MISVSRWSCGHEGCLAVAFGVGSPHALRAVGWEVHLGRRRRDDVLRCPLHFGDDDPASSGIHDAALDARMLQETLARKQDRDALRWNGPRFAAWRPDT